MPVARARQVSTLGAWVLVVTAGLAWGLAPASEADPAQAEFLEFLEYLGSWDGAEEEWVQFMGETSAMEEVLTDLEETPPTLEARAGQ